MTSSSGNRAWSEADGQAIVEMWRKGATQSEIGKHFGVGNSSIASQIGKLRRRGFEIAARDSVVARKRQARKLSQATTGTKRWPSIPMVHAKPVQADIFQSEPEFERAPRARLPTITPEWVLARRRLELILDEKTLYRTDTVRCVCGKPGAPHCAKHAAVVARVLG